MSRGIQSFSCFQFKKTSCHEFPSVSGEREWSADSEQWLLNQTGLSSDPASISQQVPDLGQITDISESYFPHL